MEFSSMRLPYLTNIICTLFMISVYQNSLIAQQTAPLSFSYQRGFYNKPFELNISSGLNEGMIHYTLDGSDPVYSQTRLSGKSPVAISIDPAKLTGGRGVTPGVVVRAVVMKDTVKAIFLSMRSDHNNIPAAPGPRLP
jgi:hypothetical protein